MKKWMVILVITLLAGCGKLSSPDFFPQLKGVVIDATTPTQFELIGQTRQYKLLGLYSTPPGSAVEFTTKPLAATAWEVSEGLLARVDSSGNATALRNGRTELRGSWGGFTSAPVQLTIAAPVLRSLVIDPASAVLPLGLTQLLNATGHYLNADGSSYSGPVSETLSWSSSAPAIASVPSSGRSVTVTSVQQSAQPALINATATAADGSVVQGVSTITVLPPDLLQVLVRDAATGANPPFNVPKGALLNLQAKGIYTHSAEPLDLPGTVTWHAADPTDLILTLLPQSNGTVNVLGNVVGSSALTATALKNDGLTVVSSAPATVNVGAAVLQSLDGARITPSPANVAVDASLQLGVIGRYSDGSEALVPVTDFNWTSANPAIAGISQTGVTNGIVQGSSVVTAALKQVPGSGAASVSAPVTVTDAICTGPLLQSQGATVEATTVSVLCLACTVSDETLAIDNDLSTFAGINVNLGLLAGSASLTATAPGNVPVAVAGQRAGFIISRPPGELLSLALLGGVSLQTLDINDQVLDAATTSDGLRLTLLGNYVIGQDAYVLSMPVSQPFRKLKVSMNAGLATVAQTLQVNSACAVAGQ